MNNAKAIILSSLIGISVLTAGCHSTAIQSDNLMEGIIPAKTESRNADDKFTSGYSDFAVKLFSNCYSENGENTLVSPLSAILALSMTANGADGQTKAEMEKVLGGELTIEELNSYLRTFSDNLVSDESFTINIANSIWFKNKQSLTIERDFLQTNADYYSAEIYKADFTQDTCDRINSWVKTNTDDMIDKIIDEIPPDAVMYLINATTFDSEWETIYKETDISNYEFTNLDGSKKTVEMMLSNEYKYIDSDNFTGFLKPYKSGKYSFAALLPDSSDFSAAVNSLNGEELNNMLKNAESNNVSVILPKFSFDYSIILNSALTNMGIVKALDGSAADFSKLGKSDDGNIYINQVKHKTFIEVNERGTRAGAATSVEMVDSSAETAEKFIVFNRPFIYMIVDNETNLPLFIGAVTDM